MRKLFYSAITVAFLTLGIAGYAYQEDVMCAAGYGCTISTPHGGGGDLPIMTCEDTCDQVCSQGGGDCGASNATDLQTNCECRCSGYDCEDEGGPCGQPTGTTPLPQVGN